MGDDDRRGAMAPLTLTEGLPMRVIVPVGDDTLAVPATLVSVTDRTLAVDLGTGALALTIELAPRCVIVVGDTRTAVRPGRRINDVHSPTRIELVLEEDVDVDAIAPADTPVRVVT